MKLMIVLILFSFALGIVISQVMGNNINFELPFSNSSERMSPSDRIKESQIFVYGDKVVLDIKDAYLAGYADTNSMDPFIDAESNGIEVKPRNEDDLHVGDVISYEYNGVGLVVHRIIAIGQDKQGRYFMLKGDNNSNEDPYKVRFDQIKYVLVGVIY